LKGKEDIIENIHASAEFSFALLMSMIRNLVPAANYATSGFWREKEDELRGIELSGKKVGIIGFGRIGKKMTNFCLAFGAKMIIYDPFVSIEKEGLNQVDTLDELLKASDIVSVHVHLDSTTKNLIGEKEFEMMRDQAYFLNTSRGGTVDEDALIKALRDRKLAAAAVDVISGEQEENISEHKLINFSKDNKNFLITPHIAGATIDSQRKAFEFALDEVDKFFN
jgi:D-3-phosphoglycerate dehydrogenase